MAATTGPSRRLIPAHAGKTWGARDCGRWRTAHPRSRGENGPRAPALRHALGSSPLTRGKHLVTRHTEGLERLIPAHAGKTRVPARAYSRRRAHPRSRGENGWPARNILPDEGSSPLTRGKQARSLDTCEGVRLIPAHAGKTALRRIVLRPASGSSPLTRGKLWRPGYKPDWDGLIPAHAGKTPNRTRL